MGRRAPEELDPLTTKPLLAIVNGPAGIDCKLEAELAEMSDEDAAAFRDGPSALDEVVRRLKDALGLITFFTAGEKETRAWTLRDGQTALEAGGTIHSDIARGFIRCEVIRWDDLSMRAPTPRRRSAAPSARGQDLRRPGRRRAQHPLQRLGVGVVVLPRRPGGGRPLYAGEPKVFTSAVYSARCLPWARSLTSIASVPPLNASR